MHKFKYIYFFILVGITDENYAEGRFGDSAVVYPWKLCLG